MAIRIQFRRDTASAWTTVNPILAEGELGLETDTGKFKVGNGTDTWSSLVYSSGPAGPTGAQGPQGLPTTVNSKTGSSITLDYNDVGADAAGAAAAAQSAAISTAASDATSKANTAETNAKAYADTKAAAAQSAAIAAAATDATTKASAAQSAAIAAAATDASTKASAAQSAATSAAATDATTKANAAETAAKAYADTLAASAQSGATSSASADATTKANAAEAAAKAYADTKDAAHVAASDPHGDRAYADSTFVPLAQKGANSGVATLDGTGKVPSSQLPGLAITSTYVVASQAAQNALSVQEGDVAVRTDLSKSFIYTGSAWQELLSPPNAVTSVNGRTGAVSLSDLFDAAGAATAAQAAAITAAASDASTKAAAAQSAATSAAATDATSKANTAETNAKAYADTKDAAHVAASDPHGDRAYADGKFVLLTDSRLTDTRAPATHAATHAAGGSDPVTVSPSQIAQGGAATNQALVWNGSAWVPATVYPARTTATVTTSSLANGASAQTTIALAKGYRIIALSTSVAARVRLYSTAAGRTADLSRDPGYTPADGSGLVLDYVTTSSTLSNNALSPVADGANLESTPSSSIPITIQNLSGSTQAVTVTLTWIQQEA